MKKVLKTLIFILLVTNNIIAQVPAATLPEFKFARTNQSLFTNKDLPSGKKLFFIFFDPECDHCQRAITYLNKNIADFKKASIFLITIDIQEKTDRFFATYGSNIKQQKNITILRDFQNDFISKFKPRKYPAMFLYSAQKKLLLYDDEEKNIINFSTKLNGKSR
ncbi:MAG: thioredoxin family protein [Ferruginibacter sp.]